MLIQNLGDKQRVLWYFPKWPINNKINSNNDNNKNRKDNNNKISEVKIYSWLIK